MKKILVLVGGLFLGASAFANEGAAASSSFSGEHGVKMLYMLSMAIAVLGGALGQSKVVAAALEGIARNPSAVDKIQTLMILGLALIESLVIFVMISIFIV